MAARSRASATMANKWSQYLLVFAHEHIDFRMPEFQSILSILNIMAEVKETEDKENPFLLLRLPSEESGRKIMSRTVLGKYLLELWASASTYTELYEKLRHCPQELISSHCRPDISFKVRVNSYGKTMKQPRQLELIDEVTEVVPFQGKVELRNPDQTFYLLEYYGTDPNNAPEKPYDIYFGRLISDGQRELINRYSVKKRHFIGNTSMAADLSLIMANQAMARPNMLVMDPFVGTGSLLVACAHFGAYVTGTDIDYNIIHGRGKSSRRDANKYRGPNESIRTNMKLYNLEKFYIDVMVADASRNIWRQQSIFDAIITDPPYGIREATRKIGSSKDYTIEEEQIAAHVPCSIGYHLADIFTDLLNFAAFYLRLGGRLVYWLPVSRPEYSPDQIPDHPCLTLISNSEQVLNISISRRLVTMEKTREIEEIEDSDSMCAEIKNDIYKGHNAIRKRYFLPRSERMKLKDGKLYNGTENQT
ncbi:tRNA (guanine(10)-N(2))-methyltransferase homolog [Ptychodera flava]|uniref:tRNA (guanine(10)-N(2))-methyltransferase homolog n=1 Tax=Ptychodera flava TaxID=63121 RepID=UPI00396A5BD6